MFQYVMHPYVGYHVAYAIYGAIEMHVRNSYLIECTSTVNIGPWLI